MGNVARPLGLDLGKLRVAPTYDEARERFKRDTAEHTLAVLKDDGLYRHLRFQKPGTWMYGFDLVTWPGYLAIASGIRTYREWTRMAPRP